MLVDVALSARCHDQLVGAQIAFRTIEIPRSVFLPDFSHNKAL
jgi:hypothetical protein